jgi:hypothetical protein
LLPDEFEAKDFKNTPAIDARACQSLLIADSIEEQDITPALFRIVDSRTIASMVDSLTRADLDSERTTEKKVIYANFIALTDSLNPLIRDSLMLITYPDSQNVTYAVLKVLPGQPADIYIYTSLNYYDNGSSGSNITNESVDIRLIRSDTTLVDYSEAMKLETVTGSVQTVSGQLVTTIRSRREFHVEPANYFVRFTISDPTKLSNIRTADGLLFFKVTIMSL